MALLWLSCPHCRVLFHIDDANAGRQVACRACGSPIRIPGAAPKVTLWFYTLERKPVGPVTFNQLKELASAGEICADALVWQEGMTHWAPATSVIGLFPTPPPVPEPPATSGEEPVEIAEFVESKPEPETSEPAYVIVDNEPLEHPVVAESEAPVSEPVVREETEAAEPREQSSVSVEPPCEDNWGMVSTPTAAEEPIEVEPEFQIDFAGSEPPPRRLPREAEAPPTVDLMLTPEAERQPVTLSADIELAPIEPKLDLGGSDAEEDAWSTGYDVAKWSPPAKGDCVAVPEPAGPPPLAPYILQGETQKPADKSVAPASDAVAAIPMALPVATPAEERPRRSTAEIQQAREAQPRQGYREERAAWRSVRTGIGIVYLTQAAWSAAIACYFVVSSAVSMFAGEGVNATSDSGAGSVLMVVLLLLLALVVDGASIFGFCLCLRVPASEGSRPLVIATLALTGCAILGAFVAPFVPGLQLIVLGMGFARWLIFLFFLQTVAHFFQSHHLTQSIERLTLLFGGGTTISLLLWFGMAYLMHQLGPATAGNDTAAMVTLACGTLCTVLPMLFLLGLTTMRYLRVMRDTAATIDGELYRG